MSLKSIKKIRALKEEQLNKIIKSAWQDRISFEEIKESLGLTEAEVITVDRKSTRLNSSHSGICVLSRMPSSA
jgi:hypothetical protein